MKDTARRAGYCIIQKGIMEKRTTEKIGTAKGSHIIKIRMQGTTQELKGWEKFLLRQNKYKVLSISETMPNKGTNRYYRQYAELEEY